MLILDYTHERQLMMEQRDSYIEGFKEGFVESYKESQEKVVQAQIAIVVEKTRKETLLYAASKMVEEFQISMDRALEVLEISEEEGV